MGERRHRSSRKLRPVTSEAARTDAIIKRLRAAGYWATKTHGNVFSRGLPDIAAVIEGRAVWLEVKVPGKKPTPLQEHVLEQLREAGAIAGVVYEASDVEDMLRYGLDTLCNMCLQSKFPVDDYMNVDELWTAESRSHCRCLS